MYLSGGNAKRQARVGLVGGIIGSIGSALGGGNTQGSYRGQSASSASPARKSYSTVTVESGSSRYYGRDVNFTRGGTMNA